MNYLEQLLDLAAKDDTNDDPWLIAYGLEQAARDQYELYKEAAEKWAEEQTPERKGGRAKCLVCERTMYFNGANGMRPEVNHTATCKAARILGLKREGAT